MKMIITWLSNCPSKNPWTFFRKSSQFLHARRCVKNTMQLFVLESFVQWTGLTHLIPNSRGDARAIHGAARRRCRGYHWCCVGRYAIDTWEQGTCGSKRWNTRQWSGGRVIVVGMCCPIYARVVVRIHQKWSHATSTDVESEDWCCAWGRGPEITDHLRARVTVEWLDVKGSLRLRHCLLYCGEGEALRERARPTQQLSRHFKV